MSIMVIVLYIKSSLRECEEFEMALCRKSNACDYKELKLAVGFEEYLKCVKGTLSTPFLKFRSSSNGLFDELGRHAKGWFCEMS